MYLLFGSRHPNCTNKASFCGNFEISLIYFWHNLSRLKIYQSSNKKGKVINLCSTVSNNNRFSNKSFVFGYIAHKSITWRLKRVYKIGEQYHVIIIHITWSVQGLKSYRAINLSDTESNKLKRIPDLSSVRIREV